MARTGNVYITINGRDNVSKTIRQVNKGLGSLSTKSLAVGTAIGTALGGIALQGINALAGGIKDAFGNAATYQKLGNQLAQTIETTGNAAQISVDGVKALAGSLESLSGVDENLIVQNANLLATFKGIENEGGKAGGTFDRTMQAALDLSTAMGIDLTAATKGLGKALSNPIKGLGALSKAGIVFTDQELKRIKALQQSGKLHEAQAIILKKVEGRFEGAAEAAGKGFEGSIARLNDAIGDLLRDAVTPLLEPLASMAEKIASDVIPAVKELFGNVGKDKSISGFVSILTKDVVPAIMRVANFIFNEIVPAVLEFRTRLMNGLMPIIKTVAGFIKNTVVPIFQSIATVVVRDVLPIIKRLADFFITRVLPAASTVAAFLAGVLGPIFRKVADVITQKVLPVVVKLANFFVNNVLPVIADLAGALWGNGSGPLPTALNAIAGVFDFVATAVGTLFGWLEDLLDILGQVAQAIADSPIGQIAGAIGGFLGNLFGGERAQGGPVAGGKAYLVGEKGPELFVPGQSGSIVPNTGLAMPSVSAGAAGGVAGEIRRAFAGLGIYLDGESVGRVSDRRLSVALATTGTTSRSAGAFRYGR